jgi:acyl-CoA synthetase (AMP-forming)/AMP-acid ligase II
LRGAMNRSTGPTEISTGIETILAERAATEPETPIIKTAFSPPLTFRRWRSEALALAARVSNADLPPNAAVLLQFAPQTWDQYAVAWAAVAMAGLVAVPVPIGLAESELERRAAVAGAGVGLCTGATGFDIQVIGDHRPLHPTRDPVIELLFTSGSADGRPRLVACGWSEFAASILHAKAGRTSRSERLGHAFLVGTNAGQLLLRSALRADTPRLVVGAGAQPDDLRRLLEEEEPNLLSLCPTEARVLVSLVKRDPGLRWQSLRAILLSGAAANRRLLTDLAEHLPGVDINNAYGLTEGGGAVLRSRYDSRYPSRLGRPGPNTEVKIVDPAGRALPAGGIGEICLRTRNLPIRHYHDEPLESAATFADGWVRTGDLGRIDETGMVNLVGRSKDVIVRGGRNVSCFEVEQAVCDVPSVVDAAVVSIGDDLLGEDLVAVAVASDGLTEGRLIRELEGRLDRFMVPSRVYEVDDLPRLPGGKIDKETLRRLIRAGALAPLGIRDAGAVLRDDRPVLDEICRIWAEVLDRPIGPADDFYLVGGDSLAILRIIGATEALVDHELDVIAFVPMTNATDFTEALLAQVTA